MNAKWGCVIRLMCFHNFTCRLLLAKAKSFIRAKWTMKLALISSFWSFKWTRVFDSPHGRLIPCMVAPSRCWYSFTHPERMESWVKLGGKRVAKRFKSRQSLGLNWGPFGWKAEILPTVRTTPAQTPYHVKNLFVSFYKRLYYSFRQIACCRMIRYLNHCVYAKNY